MQASRRSRVLACTKVSSRSSTSAIRESFSNPWVRVGAPQGVMKPQKTGAFWPCSAAKRAKRQGSFGRLSGALLLARGGKAGA